MGIRKKTKKILKPISRLSLRTRIIILSSIAIIIGYVIVFALPKTVTFSYSEATCVRQLTFAPSTMKQVHESGYEVAFKDTVTIAGHPVASLTACFTPVAAPEKGESMVATSPYGSWVLARNYLITVSDAPTVKTDDFIGKTLPTTRPLALELSSKDTVFSYKLAVNEREAKCAPKGDSIECDIERLYLKQGEAYQASLIRYFGDDKYEKLGSGEIKTLLPLTLTGASVSEGQTIYDKPASLSFEYDKPIETVIATLKVKNGDTSEPVKVTTSTEGNKALVTPVEPLKRNAQYQVTLSSVEAKDGSALPAQHVVNFLVSGGPKVTGISVGSSGVPRGGTITISLDQEIKNVDKIASLVVVQGVAASVARSGNNLIVSYNSAPACGTFSISVKKGLESQAEVAQEEDWNFNGRFTCYSVRTFGTSKQGRAMNAYIFGSGGKTILYTGTIHGNEIGTRALMNAWINELDANAQSIPAGVRIVVVPSINPDGAAAGSRYNSNNVDLNRNFDTTDWKQDIETPYKQPHPGGGGSAPNSEPETVALAAYTRELQPYLTMSYHSQAGYVIANSCGNSPALAAKYSELSGYRNMTGVSSAFAYEITGTYDDWMCQRLGYQSVLIELATTGSSEFGRNKSALWAMARS